MSDLGNKNLEPSQLLSIIDLRSTIGFYSDEIVPGFMVLLTKRMNGAMQTKQWSTHTRFCIFFLKIKKYPLKFTQDPLSNQE